MAAVRPVAANGRSTSALGTGTGAPFGAEAAFAYLGSVTVAELVLHNDACCMQGAQPEWGPHPACAGQPSVRRAISIRQPWAWAILHAGKDVENRGRRDPWIGAVGERVFLHAAKTEELYDYGTVRRIGGKTPEQPLPLGALVGAASIAGVHHADQCSRFWADVDESRMCSPWAQPDQWHIQLRDVETLTTPIPWRGALGLFAVAPLLNGGSGG